MIEFQAFPKIHRLCRTCTVTEKIDGTNASIIIDGDGNMGAASRKRIITPEGDNHGFAAWVRDNEEELAKLGEGRHFGEWWGQGIQRKYGLSEKRFSLFNMRRWEDDEKRPQCCHVVPTLYTGIFDTNAIHQQLSNLARDGSAAAPGFDRPEGIVIYHHHARQLFKVTLEKDDASKWELSQ